MKRLHTFIIVTLLIMASSITFCDKSSQDDSPTIELKRISGYRSGVFRQSETEISAFDPQSKRVFTVSGYSPKFRIFDLSNPEEMVLLKTVSVKALGKYVNSACCYNGLVAVAIENYKKTSNSIIGFFDIDGNFITSVESGPLTDMVTFTPNGKYLLAANEGEPDDDYAVDPEGSISIIEIPQEISAISQDNVTNITFHQFDNQELPEYLHIAKPGALPSVDFEPEYIAVSEDSQIAFVTLQENNGVAVIDIENKKVIRLFGLKYKNHSLPGNYLDVSDEDGSANLSSWPVFGMPQPDGIKTKSIAGKQYIFTANEGDSRNYSGYNEEIRISEMNLDKATFPDIENNKALGRLKATTSVGDIDGDGDFDKIFTFGTRSFSIFDDHGKLVFDSGDDFEQITMQRFPKYFNCSNDYNGSFDHRSDDKGPEPEEIAIGEIGGRIYAFIGLERIGGVMVYDVTDPANSHFLNYLNERDFEADIESEQAGELGPEGMEFIPASISPNGKDLLMVTSEVSGSIAIYQVIQKKHPE